MLVAADDSMGEGELLSLLLLISGSGAGVTMGELEAAPCSTWCLVIASFAACGIGFSFGLHSEMPMWRYMCSGSIRKR